MSTATVECVTPPSSDALQVTILYEDFVAGLRAKSILDHLMNRLDPAAECRSDWCRLDLLHQPTLAVETMKKVVAADIVMISAHGTTPQSGEAGAWLEVWLQRRRNRSGALVVSLDTEARDLAVGQRILLQFRVLAARTGLVLFSHYGDLPGGDNPPPFQEEADAQECATVLPLDILHHPK